MSEGFVNLFSDENESKSFWDPNLHFPQLSEKFDEDFQNLNFDYDGAAKLGGALDEDNDIARESKFDGSEDKSSSYWKSARYEYGINYNIMTKEPIYVDRNPPAKVEGVEMAEYCRKLYECKADQDSLLAAPEVEHLVYGEKWNGTLSEYDWCLQTNADGLDQLTILDLQSAICASLNSKQTLVWVIGIESTRLIRGVPMDRKQRDSFRQSCDFALSNEFLPALNPTLVSLRFLPVVNAREEELYVIEITVPQTVDTIYQLSHGRIFCVEDGRPKLFETFNDAYQVLLSNSETKYTCPYHPKRSSTSPFYLGVFAGVILSVLIIGAYTR
ncbi:unnamed protein product [Auanema sp. JU1783]|nr:unnamed protein product [Auanema sp. JU1783]